MASGLVDLSLFDMPPPIDQRQPSNRNSARQTFQHYFDAAAPYRHPHYESVWQPSRPRYTATFPQYSEPNGNKPLPALPKKWFCERKFENRREQDIYASKCILARMKRLRIEYQNQHLSQTPPLHRAQSTPVVPTMTSHATQTSSHGHEPTLRERRHVDGSSQLSLAVPPPRSTRQRPQGGRPALPMIWLPDEEMWLIAAIDDDQDNGYNAFPSMDNVPFNDDYIQNPRSARSEPSPDTDDPDLSPVRSQFRMLMERRPLVDARYSPPLQEAIHGMGIYNDEDVDAFGNPESPIGIRIERDWQDEAESGIEDFQSAKSAPSFPRSSVYSVRSLVDENNQERFEISFLYDQTHYESSLNVANATSTTIPVRRSSLSPRPQATTLEEAPITDPEVFVSQAEEDYHESYVSDPRNYRISTVSSLSALSDDLDGGPATIPGPSDWRAWSVKFEDEAEGNGRRGSA